VQRFYDRPTLILQWVNPDTGQRRSKSARTTDWEMAEIARRNLEYELNHGIYQESSKLEWRQFRELFEGEYLAGLRPLTSERYIGVLDVFERIVKPEILSFTNPALKEQLALLILKADPELGEAPQLLEQLKPGSLRTALKNSLLQWPHLDEGWLGTLLGGRRKDGLSEH
jgi:hypothetical protein